MTKAKKNTNQSTSILFSMVAMLACGLSIWLPRHMNQKLFENVLLISFCLMIAVWRFRKPLSKVLRVLAKIRLPKKFPIHVSNKHKIGEIKLRLLEKKLEWCEMCLKDAKSKQNSKMYKQLYAEKQTLDKKRRLIIKERLRA